MEGHLDGPTASERNIVVLPEMQHDIKHRWEAAASTDTGLLRKGNEDAFEMDMDGGAFVICDGMGGAAAGEVASKLAAHSFMAAINASGKPDEQKIRDAVRNADDAVRQAAQLDPSRRGMGTTLVALVVEKDAKLAFLVHAGDSRCYRFREDHLEQMTADHSFVEEQVRSGQITPEEAQRSPLRNVITRAIGSSEPTEADIMEIDLSSGDIYLLCSDGLNREVSDETLRDVLKKERNLSSACSELIQEAISEGGRDNITCMLVRIL